MFSPSLLRLKFSSSSFSLLYVSSLYLSFPLISQYVSLPPALPPSLYILLLFPFQSVSFASPHLYLSRSLPHLSLLILLSLWYYFSDIIHKRHRNHLPFSLSSGGQRAGSRKTRQSKNGGGGGSDLCGGDRPGEHHLDGGISDEMGLPLHNRRRRHLLSFLRPPHSRPLRARQLPPDNGMRRPTRHGPTRHRRQNQPLLLLPSRHSRRRGVDLRAFRRLLRAVDRAARGPSCLRRKRIDRSVNQDRLGAWSGQSEEVDWCGWWEGASGQQRRWSLGLSFSSCHGHETEKLPAFSAHGMVSFGMLVGPRKNFIVFIFLGFFLEGEESDPLQETVALIQRPPSKKLTTFHGWSVTSLVVDGNTLI